MRTEQFKNTSAPEPILFLDCSKRNVFAKTLRFGLAMYHGQTCRIVAMSGILQRRTSRS
jgi:hypothetical protein